MKGFREFRLTVLTAVVLDVLDLAIYTSRESWNFGAGVFCTIATRKPRRPDVKLYYYVTLQVFRIFRIR